MGIRAPLNKHKQGFHFQGQHHTYRNRFAKGILSQNPPPTFWHWTLLFIPAQKGLAHFSSSVCTAMDRPLTISSYHGIYFKNCDLTVPHTHRASQKMYGLIILNGDITCWLNTLAVHHPTQVVWRSRVVSAFRLLS